MAPVHFSVGLHGVAVQHPGSWAAATNAPLRHHPDLITPHCPGRESPVPGLAMEDVPMGPRLGAEPEPCWAGCPTSWFTEGSLLIPPPWTLFMGERTGP